MSINLLKKTKELISKQLISKSSLFLDESYDDVKEAINLIIPLILSGFIHFYNRRPEVFIELIDKYHIKNKENRKLKSLFSGDNSLLLDKNYHFLSNFFNTAAVTSTKDIISQYNNIHQESVMSLLKMVITPILIAIDDSLNNENHLQQGLPKLLKSQKQIIDSNISVDFMNKMIDEIGFYTLKNNINSTKTTTNNSRIIKIYSKVGIGLLGFIITFILFNNFLLKKERRTSDNVLTQKIIANTIDDPNVFYSPNGLVLNKYFKGYENLGYLTKRDLKNGKTIFTLSNGGLNNFLNYVEKDMPVSKTAWFDLNRVLVINKELIDIEKSTSEIDNLAEILNAYPNLSIKIGALTDNTGPADKNFEKSYKLAEKFMTLLIKKGISSNRLRYEGYGENYPIKSDESGKKYLNNRIAIRLTAK